MQRHGSLTILEIGTLYGTSAAYLASNPANHVVTVDLDVKVKDRVAKLGFPNIKVFIGNSLLIADQVAREGPFDFAFIDGNHIFEAVYGDYVLYRKSMKPGGFMFFDDIHHPVGWPEMDVFWSRVTKEPKTELPALHDKGFGVVKVDPSVSPLPLESLKEEAEREIWSKRYLANNKT